ncbi:MAG TPA: MG2 domain-containing protein, partial [Chitinophagaceae bacterium]|nr:MG2 domain-containing protein [Chitinophagaceae bacterium]
ATTEVAEISSGLASPFILNINDISAEHDGTTGSILVKTSQQPANANLSPYLAVKPAVKFSVELTEEGFLVSSDAFDPAKSYELTIMKGMRGKLGGVLNEGYTNNLAFGALEPSISFANRKAIFLSAQGLKNIEVRITNVPKLKVIISKIYENNLIAAEHYGYYPKVTSDDDNRDYEGEQGNATAGDVIYEKEIDSRSLPRYGNSRLFNFNIADRLQGSKGIYHISIRSSEQYWINDSRFISLSDIGLIAKEGKDRMYVFANSLKSAIPVNGANVLVYGYNNQLLGMAATNAEGVAEIAYTRKEYAGFRPALVIAKTADDFNYLPFTSTRVNTSRFDAGGKQTNPTGLDAFIYGERDIYRPGESVHFSVIVRDKTWAPPGELPLKLKFLMPNGKEFKTFRKTLNEQGSIEGSIDINSSAITGTYSLEVYTSNDLLLSSKVFMIEEFVPDRIKVSAQLNKPVLKPGETATFQLNAVNFFGPPAANRNYETEIQTRQKVFNPKKFNNYNFTFANQTSFFDKVVKEGKTDDNGDATEIYEVPKTYVNVGILQAVFYATVFDETGRPVSRSTTADILTQPVFLGLGEEPSGYYPLNQVVKFPLVALDINESLANGTKASVKIIRHEYKTVLAKTGSYFRYDSQKEEKLISDNNVTISGENTMFSFVPRSPGEYEIRLSLPASNSYVSRSFYSYGNWGSANNSFEVNTEGNVEIVTDKPSYNSGESAKVLFKTPFSGRMLVTMETDKVVWHQYVQVEKRSVSLDLKITTDHLPNVYVTATLIKPHDVSDIPLTVAHGYQNVKVEEKDRKLPVEILAQKSVRSKTHQKVTVRSAPGSYITLAAVDNGVLQVSDFKTPDPYDYFYSKHALEVNGYDIYPLLYPEIKPNLSSTGGDADLEMSKRTNPIPNKRVKIVSYWSGITKANGNGESNIEFDIPEYSGQLRLMALAYKNKSFGSGGASMTVADPVVLSTALPRFLSPGDTMSVPVNISNTTARNTTAIARITTSGPLQVVGDNSQSVSLNANSEARPIFKVVASAVVNAGRVMTEVQGLGEKFTSETEITVRPSSTLQKLSGSGSIAGNSSLNLQMPKSDFLPGSSKYRLMVSRWPVMEIGSQLNYLMQFPYGCTEQVISAAFPQLYFGELATLMKTSFASAGTSNTNIQEAIRKIQLRQLYN